MSDVTVTTWCDLQHKLFEGSFNTSINRYRSPFVYRGLSVKSAANKVPFKIYIDTPLCVNYCVKEEVRYGHKSRNR